MGMECDGVLNKILVPLTLDNDFIQNINNTWFPGKLGVEHFHLLHVLGGGLANKEQANRILEGRVSLIKQSTYSSASYEVTEGHAATEIVERAKAGYFDLIMIPANNKNFLLRMMLGSTTTEVIRMTDTPVLIYKQGSLSLNTILYATDFGEAADKALNYVGFLGKISSKLIIQHVGRRAADPQAEYRREEVASQKLEETKRQLTPYWTEIDMISSLGTPSRIISSSAKEHKIDLLVLGKGNTGVMKKILGSTAEKIANTIESSIMIVP
ncbi:MAG: hypothetical protein APF84_02105 [Gracilibacter sp. BRH_c7a]|nr:MAG: hypothetical protein APF84_02105 [Gracilibacter sp. BRH_c7a]